MEDIVVILGSILKINLCVATIENNMGTIVK